MAAESKLQQQQRDPLDDAFEAHHAQQQRLANLGPLTKLLLAMGAGEEWVTMPWRVWKPPSEVWAALPTFVIAEWGYRAAAWIAFYHAGPE